MTATMQQSGTFVDEPLQALLHDVQRKHFIILQGHVLDQLKKIPSKSVWCVITSPPYRALRDYDAEPVIWDINPQMPNCQHDWAEYDLNKNNRQGMSSGIVTSRANKKSFGKSRICKTCGSWLGQLGHEPTTALYIKHLVDIFREVRRILKDGGSLWVNIGETFNGNKKGNTDLKNQNVNTESFEKFAEPNIAPKSQIGVPERFKVAMIDDGWVCRDTVIWEKDNVIPSSALDRFTPSHEFFYHFVKSFRPLWYSNEKRKIVTYKKPVGIKGEEGLDWEWRPVQPDDLEQRKKNGKAFPKGWVQREDRSWWKKLSLWSSHDYYHATQYEPYSEETLKQIWKAYKGQSKKDYAGHMAQDASNTKRSVVAGIERKLERLTLNIAFGGNKLAGGDNPVYSGNLWQVGFGRNKRTVWTINTQPMPESHFAVFPEALVEIPIKASCPEFVCKKCGLPKIKIYTETRVNTRPGEDTNNGKSGNEGDPHEFFHQSDWSKYRQQVIRTPTSEYIQCDCNAGFEAGVVLDTFGGTMTTLKVAMDNGRVGFATEQSDKYVEIGERRLKQYKDQGRLEEFDENNKNDVVNVNSESNVNNDNNDIPTLSNDDNFTGDSDEEEEEQE